ncbi:MAG: ATP-binding protein [Dehalococcoidia bacterium]
MSILIVDDFPGVRFTLEATLREAGYHDLLLADSAKEAFQKLGMEGHDAVTPDVDLILMDISMPEVDGVEACQRIKASPRLRDIPIIMVTGLADVQNLESAFAAGAVDYITRPPQRVEMLARVGSALDGKREMDRRKSAYVYDLENKNRELEIAFAALEEKNRQLEEASLAKTQILSTATHELKTPLTSIVGYIDRMLLREDTVGSLSERQRRYLETVQKNAHRLKALVDDLLDISRIEAGSLQVSLIDLSVPLEIEDVIQSLKTQIRDKDIEVVLEIAPDLPDIKGDRLRFSQVMGNLLSNAVKYSPNHATVTIEAKEHQAYVQVSVSDTGIGMSGEDQAHLFTKFFRADNSSTREQSGTGLGLYITKHLVEAHGGGIWAKSRLGEGTTFALVWPRANVDSVTPEPSETTVQVSGQ